MLRVKDPDIIRFIAAMPENRQNATVKNIIRKHLNSQMAASGNLFFSPVPSPVSAKPKAVTKKEFPEPASPEEPDGTVAEKVHGETDEDREALLAFLRCLRKPVQKKDMDKEWCKKVLLEMPKPCRKRLQGLFAVKRYRRECSSQGNFEKVSFYCCRTRLRTIGMAVP